ncbi:hypothetical protein CLV58_10311 [Spirosoma oryzae]|uniref:Uncharacterized protein n=1 Tax=Spirosoma oryzae TaxID=1469603 RepID=A0A2T0TEE7_9BACT|nr:glycoside hydrolase family 127 protein [Spirosoma oryzae]PRY44042.1 hypothetical protein CLV58_10311 [Spirosoma oryzae]
MLRISSLLLVCLLTVPGLLRAQRTDGYVVNPVAAPQATPFPLADVRLLPGSPFQRAMAVNARYLLQLDPDRFLHRWRTNAGLPPKGPLYGGWEGPASGSSHMLGHYLSALAIQYAASGERPFLDKLTYTVAELATIQQARRSGYIGGIPKEDSVWHDVIAGRIQSQGFDLNGAWVPWYMLHKVWAGLIDAYTYAGNQQAKAVVVKLSDWAYTQFIDMPDASFQRMLQCEHGGMNESLAEVYAITGDKRYLALSRKFNHHRILDPLANQIDALAGEHANTQIPKVIGVARQYELTGDEAAKTTADFFWETVVGHHSYANGGNSNYEYFQDADRLNRQLSPNTTETCNTYNMLKLTRHRFGWQPSARLVDYYERALYNHILASQHPQSGMLCYFTPMQAGKRKAVSTPFDSFWCCVGTGLENHAKYAESIYFRGADGSLYVNLFMPSLLSWREKGLTLRQETTYPAGETTTLTVQATRPARFPLRIRYPGWAGNGLTITVNGKPVPVNTRPGSYVTVDRVWNANDVVRVTIPMRLHTEALPDNRQRVAVLYGPLLLSGVLGKTAPTAADLPVLVTDNHPVGDWLRPVAGQPLTFRTAGVGRPHDVELMPLYSLFDQHYTVYWDLFSTQGWATRKAAYEAEQKRQQDLDARTIDQVRLGEMQPEKDHHFSSEQSTVSEVDGRKGRTLRNGGWFSVDLACDPTNPVAISSLYYGSDQREGAFSILVDGVALTTAAPLPESGSATLDGLFAEHVYPIPAALTAGKTKLTVRFQALPGQPGRPSFGLRLVRQPPAN